MTEEMIIPEVPIIEYEVVEATDSTGSEFEEKTEAVKSKKRAAPVEDVIDPITGEVIKPNTKCAHGMFLLVL
jgi:glycine cleavage system H lipoate-binding protein